MPNNRALSALIEESEDLHSDAMHTTNAGLADLVEQGCDRRADGDIDVDEIAEYQTERSRVLTKSLAGAGLVGVGLTRLLAAPAFAQSGMDVQAAQTAASLENLAIAVYNQAAALPFMQNIPDPAGATVVAFVTKTVEQHTDHMKAFNAAAAQLGGKAQDKPDQVVFDTVVTPALPTLKTPLDVVKFAATLELVAAETYLAEISLVSDKNLRNTFASIMGVENQHRAILLAVGALLEAGHPELIMLGPPADQLPAAAGSVGFPDTFLKTDQARPAAEGAVK
jgi:rubrerythrin